MSTTHFLACDLTNRDHRQDREPDRRSDREWLRSPSCWTPGARLEESMTGRCVVWVRQREPTRSSREHDEVGVGESRDVSRYSSPSTTIVRRGDLSRGRRRSKPRTFSPPSAPTFRSRLIPSLCGASQPPRFPSSPPWMLDRQRRHAGGYFETNFVARSEHAGAVVDQTLSRGLARQEQRIASFPTHLRPLRRLLPVRSTPPTVHAMHTANALAPEPESTRDVTGVVIDPDVDLSTTQATVSDGVLQITATGAKPGTSTCSCVCSVPEPSTCRSRSSLRTERRGGNATAVIPRDLAAADLLIEVTTNPYAPPLPPFVRNVTRAVRHGQDASRFGRRGHT